MEATLDRTQADEIVNEAKAEFGRAKDRLVHCLETTPEDKLNWSPAPSARTPLQAAAHAALSTLWIKEMLQGKNFEFPGVAEMDAAAREEEKEYTSREKVLSVIDETTKEYLAFLDGLTPEVIASTWHAPFGDFPMSRAITFAADHIRNHCGQIDYIQTIYGDRDWHIG